VAPALSPLEIERQITARVEQALSGLPAWSRCARSRVRPVAGHVVFEDGTDIYLARQVVAERLHRRAAAGVERPRSGPVATGLGEVFHYLVTGDGQSPGRAAHRSTTGSIKPQLRSVPGVAEVNAWGGDERQIQSSSIRRRSTPAASRSPSSRGARAQQRQRRRRHARPGRRVDAGPGRRAHHPQARDRGHRDPRESTACRSACATSPGGRGPRDPARRGHRRRQGRGRARPRLHADRREQPRRHQPSSRRGSPRIQKTLPEGASDVDAGLPSAPTLVDHVLDTVRTNLLEGALLVIAVLFVFLGSLRAGLIVALGDPAVDAVRLRSHDAAPASPAA
jgi:cobalt-zinc-cadmium resistance protein CzcA